MGLLEDIKKEWTWEGFKKSLRENWIDLLSVLLIGNITPIILKYKGWEDSALAFFLVFLLLYLLVFIVRGLIMGIIRKIKE